MERILLRYSGMLLIASGVAVGATLGLGLVLPFLGVPLASGLMLTTGCGLVALMLLALSLIVTKRRAAARDNHATGRVVDIMPTGLQFRAGPQMLMVIEVQLPDGGTYQAHAATVVEERSAANDLVGKWIDVIVDPLNHHRLVLA